MEVNLRILGALSRQARRPTFHWQPHPAGAPMAQQADPKTLIPECDEYDSDGTPPAVKNVLDMPAAWLQQVLCSDLLTTHDLVHLMHTCWALCEAVLQFRDVGRLIVEVRVHTRIGGVASNAIASHRLFFRVQTCHSTKFLSHDVRLCAQLKDDYTVRQLEWWRRVLSVAPNLPLQFWSHGEVGAVCWDCI
jgi:hypothetical protein